MARLTVAAVLGLTVALGGAASVRAAEDLEAAALEAGVDATDLAGAVNSTGLAPREYLIAAGELQVQPMPQPLAATSNPRVDCVIHYESRGNPMAVNPRSGAAGLGQFLPSTWRTTPQGQAGYSVFNATANREAVAWMLRVGRAREFEVITRGLC